MSDARLEKLAEELYAARSIEAEGGPARARLSLADIHAFLTDPRVRLSSGQERLLITEPRLWAGYLRLKRELSVYEMPAAAAASTGPASTRQFTGGSIEIKPSRSGRQVYVMIRIDDPSRPPRALLMESQSGLIARTALPDPDPEGSIQILKDLDVAEDKQLVDLIADPNATGALLAWETFDVSPGLERLLERTRHEGLLDRPQREARWRNWLARLTQRWHRDEIVWLPRLSVPIAVAASLVFGVFVLMRIAVTPEQDTELFVPRGGSTPQVVFTDDPAKLLSQMQDGCVAAGLLCEVLGKDSVKALEIRLPKQPDERTAAFFSRYGIKPVPNGATLVQVRPKTTQ